VAAGTCGYVWWSKAGTRDVRGAIEVSMAFVRGKDEAAMVADCIGWYRDAVRPYVFPAMAAQVAAHREAGHVLAILTSATRYLAEPLGADLGIEHHLVTQLIVREGRFTGEVVQAGGYGRGQVYWARRLAGETGGGRRRELLLQGSDRGPAAARSRGAPTCGTPRSTAATPRSAPRLAGAATTAGRDDGHVAGARRLTEAAGRSARRGDPGGGEGRRHGEARR